MPASVSNDPERLKALVIAEKILAGEIPPFAGARRIWALYVDRDALPDDIRVWVGLASEWEDQPAHREAYEADILDEARLMLERFANPE